MNYQLVRICKNCQFGFWIGDPSARENWFCEIHPTGEQDRVLGTQRFRPCSEINIDDGRGCPDWKEKYKPSPLEPQTRGDSLGLWPFRPWPRRRS